jgi:hypothetical protein
MDRSNRSFRESGPLFLLFLQEIISDGSFLRRRNAGRAVSYRKKEQRDLGFDAG